MNAASESKGTLKKWHYAIESATAREIVAQQYDYQLYPNRLKKLLEKTGAGNLKIIPIGDFDKDNDYWVIPYEILRDWLVVENLTKGLTKHGDVRRARWRFHIEDHRFILFPGKRERRGNIDVRQYYGAQLPSAQIPK
jgi:hypothetical protein